MDENQYMIIDKERPDNKQIFITKEVSSIKNNGNGRWSVGFYNSSRIFNYNMARLLVMSHPEHIDIKKKGLYIRNKRISNLASLLRFKNDEHQTFYHVVYNDGKSENFEGKDIYVTRTSFDEFEKTTWGYLKKSAAETGLLTDTNDNILSKQYDLIDEKRDNVPLAHYLGAKTKLASYPKPELIYYPFGCNASQKVAVEAALTNQLSIIQGPPGTGKTQTILNIIANLIIARKTVLVVSNNNSAVENVAEKLANHKLDFIVAQLGSVQNKELFIARQDIYPDMSNWRIENPDAIRQSVKDALSVVSKGFNNQIHLASLKAEYDAFVKEAKYNDMLAQDNVSYDSLNGKSASLLIKLLNQYRRIIENGKNPSFWFRLKWAYKLGYRLFSFLQSPSTQVIACLETAYYHTRKTEIEKEMQTIHSSLDSIDIKKGMNDLQSFSLQLLKSSVANKYIHTRRPKFSMKDIKPRTEEFLNEYPIVLSTTYSAKSCISNDTIFDYVIMDEASQVDIKTGALSLSCAANAVIVGDDKQLPNVVTQKETTALNTIFESYHVEEKYNAVTHSFLQSCIEVFSTAPVTLLREHYRCHPLIIGFCNQHFYDGELIAMTADQSEENVLKVVRTVKGNHARDHFNQREIDVIAQEVLPQYATEDRIGIITPYRLQAEKINNRLEKDIASTVHKYQGRECDTIIMSMVDNEPTAFSDDANLLNVAISRAKKHLCIVTSGNDIPQESNIAQLIDYVRYNNFDISQSKLHSVFDLLYKPYTAERLAYQSTHPSVSDQLSENLIYELLIKAINEMRRQNMEVLCHYPLSKLIADWSILNDQEKTFANNPLTHVDFLLYNSLTKRPLFIIEVDGWKFHGTNIIQQSRDKLKDQILTKFGICPHRISTTETVSVESIKEIIQHSISSN